MTRAVYRFTFSRAADLVEAEATLHLALYVRVGQEAFEELAHGV